MYEGKNIHFSLVDNKPLCSFSNKKCNQRRLNGYGFCVRHIVEDASAPFRRCCFVAKSSGIQCTQGIPIAEDRLYCNNHMQVLGMIPRRERKSKVPKKNKECKAKLCNSEVSKTSCFENLAKSQSSVDSSIVEKLVYTIVDNHEDPYDFNDNCCDVSSANGLGHARTCGIISCRSCDVSYSPSTAANSCFSHANVSRGNIGSGIQTKSNMYPKLVEKLGKTCCSNVDIVGLKSCPPIVQSVNKLQKTIAQIKGTDMLLSEKHGQLHLATDVMCSADNMNLSVRSSVEPLVSRTDPCLGFLLGKKNCNHTTKPTGLNVCTNDTSAFESKGMAAAPVSASSSVLSQHLCPRAVFPPPYYGIAICSAIPYFVLDPVLHSIAPSRCGNKHNPVTSNVPTVTPLMSHRPAPLPVMCSYEISSALTTPHSTISQQLRSKEQAVSVQLVSVSHSSCVADVNCVCCRGSVILSQTVTPPPSHVNSETHKAVDNAQYVPSMLSTCNTGKRSDTHLMDLPPPPYRPPVTSASESATSPTHMSSNVTVPTGVLSEKRVRQQGCSGVGLCHIHTDSLQHSRVFLAASFGLGISDKNESVDNYVMNSDILPIQRDVAIFSDDEEDNEVEEDGELPSDLRLAKLGVVRARQRRHCTQTKHASRFNTHALKPHKHFTVGLINLVRKNPSSAARLLAAIYGVSLQWPKNRCCTGDMLYCGVGGDDYGGGFVDSSRKRRSWCRPLCHKICMYKEGDGSSRHKCPVACLPFTNHCRKHVMYNVEQQLFQFCTARNDADDAQCCMPVIDLLHDFPLCFPHGSKKKLDTSLMWMNKRSRKKSKPSALTRPPRRGRRKRLKVFHANMCLSGQPVISAVPSVSGFPVSETSLCHSVAMNNDIDDNTAPDTSVAVTSADSNISVRSMAMTSTGSVAVSMPVVIITTVSTTPAPTAVLEPSPATSMASMKATTTARMLEQALGDLDATLTNALGERSGDTEALTRETEKLERQLAEVRQEVKAKDTLDKLLRGAITMDDVNPEDTNSLAHVIANHLNVPMEPMPVAQHDMTACVSSAAPMVDLARHTVDPSLVTPSMSQRHGQHQSRPPTIPCHISQCVRLNSSVGSVMNHSCFRASLNSNFSCNSVSGSLFSNIPVVHKPSPANNHLLLLASLSSSRPVIPSTDALSKTACSIPICQYQRECFAARNYNVHGHRPIILDGRFDGLVLPQRLNSRHTVPSFVPQCSIVPTLTLTQQFGRLTPTPLPPTRPPHFTARHDQKHQQLPPPPPPSAPSLVPVPLSCVAVKHCANAVVHCPFSVMSSTVSNELTVENDTALQLLRTSICSGSVTPFLQKELLPGTKRSALQVAGYVRHKMPKVSSPSELFGSNSQQPYRTMALVQSDASTGRLAEPFLTAKLSTVQQQMPVVCSASQLVCSTVGPSTLTQQQLSALLKRQQQQLELQKLQRKQLHQLHVQRLQAGTSQCAGVSAMAVAARCLGVNGMSARETSSSSPSSNTTVSVCAMSHDLVSQVAVIDGGVRGMAGRRNATSHCLDTAFTVPVAGGSRIAYQPAVSSVPPSVQFALLSYRNFKTPAACNNSALQPNTRVLMSEVSLPVRCTLTTQHMPPSLSQLPVHPAACTAS